MADRPATVIGENLMELPTNLMATLPFILPQTILEWLTGQAIQSARGPQDTWSNEIVSDVILGIYTLTKFELMNGVYCRPVTP